MVTQVSGIIAQLSVAVAAQAQTHQMEVLIFMVVVVVVASQQVRVGVVLAPLQDFQHLRPRTQVSRLTLVLLGLARAALVHLALAFPLA